MPQASTLCLSLILHSFTSLSQSHVPSATASYSIKSSTNNIYFRICSLVSTLQGLCLNGEFNGVRFVYQIAPSKVLQEHPQFPVWVTRAGARFQLILHYPCQSISSSRI
ncbi:hypothetical protein GLYMA_16G147100v4 [Glycine max]|nr:hypothetical protein JHK86_045513 [Glycine max]KAG4941424.1 hypothetical protein JHK87_045295 [Glycine soja]KAG4952226.1 hypothetical protein JHK85_046093 [Glycine max]KRH08405.1 hypothetical protein GLYMA_16G147100v4 [Glycine max]